MEDAGHLEYDPRRTFTRAEVFRAWTLQGQVCNLCHRAIAFDLLHGDHVVPWIIGGKTEFANLQALCGSCNLRKGSKPQDVVAQYSDLDRCVPGKPPLRRWQAEAIPIVLDQFARGPVLVEACPGAGKTRFGLEIAYRLLEAQEISRVLIVVPTLGVADGWLRAASRASPEAPTLPLHGPRDWRPVNPIGDSWVGTVTTYQSLFAMTEMFLAHATDPGHRTLVIFDEVHHAGAESGWGLAAQEAFLAGAHATLSLSGTPFRTNRDPIAFVPSEGGSAHPQFRYSYRDAIVDGACRPVQFVVTKGETTFRTEDGVVHTVTFDDQDLTDVGVRRRLRAALEWIEPGSIADKMLQDANQYLLGLRQAGDHDAAGLVVCVDCDHADRVASHMAEHVLPRRPVVACSRLHDATDPSPANAVNDFGRSHDPWIVAVNMVSEGIDIRRLRSVVYLTNRSTLLSFRQIVGRVVRTDRCNVDDHRHVYIPADPRLLDMARQVSEEVDLLPPPMVIYTDTQSGQPIRITGEDGERYDFQVLETIGRQGEAFDTSGRNAEAELLECAKLFILHQGLRGTDPASLALAAKTNPQLLQHLRSMLPPPPPPPPLP